MIPLSSKTPSERELCVFRSQRGFCLGFINAHGEVEKYYGETSAPLKKFSTFQYVEGEKGKRVKVKQQQNEKN